MVFRRPPIAVARMVVIAPSVTSQSLEVAAEVVVTAPTLRGSEDPVAAAGDSINRAVQASLGKVFGEAMEAIELPRAVEVVQPNQGWQGLVGLLAEVVRD